MKTSTRLRNAARTRPRNYALAGLTILLSLVLSAGSGRAQDHWVIHHFTGPDGASPGSLLLSDATLFGTTASGGSSNCGTVFRLNADGSDYRVLRQFTGRDGAKPFPTLVLSDATLYGRTSEGGVSNRGTVFKINTDGSGFALLREFTDSDVANVPRNLALAGESLYGVAYNGGCSNRGAICKLKTDGSEFAVIKDFTDPVEGGAGYSEGCLPGGLLAASGTTLYGSTVGGGASSEGGIFKINTDGTGYTVLKQGSFAEGGHFTGGVIVSGNTLYGASPWGGGGIGAIFRLSTDGRDFSILRSCHPFEVHMASSLAVSGSWLCVVSQQLSTSNNSVIFILSTNGSHFNLLKRFNDAEGPPRGLVMSGTTLYGVTSLGGHSNRGTIFGINLQPPAILQPPQSQTAETGATVRFSAQVEGTLEYEWLFNGIKVLSDSTNAMLRLTNVQSAQAGAYAVVVTNLFGGVTSSPAMLNVIAPVERRLVPGVKLTGTAGSVLNLHCATALRSQPNWIPLGTVTLTSASQYWCDDSIPLPPERFYRASQAAPADMVSTLDLHLIPALTLTGTSGQSVRVDAINAVGPTDAWFTLDTVTLTNTAQLYFDVTAPDRPRRLYRLVPVP